MAPRKTNKGPKAGGATEPAAATATSPGAGERRAIGGYQGQYRFAASVVLSTLRDGTLQWIRIADPQAGRLDDLQVATARQVDAYQIKWSRYPGSLTFRDLTTSSAESPPLIAQLADGWKRLRALHGDRQVVVHLVTNDQASVGDEVVSARAGEARHFAAFLGECWFPRACNAATNREPVPAKWTAAWERLVAASGLSAVEFEEFLGNCNLDLGVRPHDPIAPWTARTATGVREAALWREDMNALNIALFQLVADQRQLVEVARERLLATLGWNSRIEFRNSHEFPAPSLPYHEISTTAAALEASLEHAKHGYVLVLGTPGSGKSTLVTRFLRYRAERVVRYYAYIPDALEPNAQRGESVNFLHDVTLALEHHGFRTGDTLARPEVGQLAARMHTQLRMLHDDYRRTGRRTVLVVDGLDHIAREQFPERPLLADLPTPSQVPEGVTIVLSSQTDQLPGLPVGVQAQLREPERRVAMQRLSRAETVEILDNANLNPSPDATAIERIVDLAAGHPLALAYIVNQLRLAGDTSVMSRLDMIAPFRERIDEQYEFHWLAVEGDHAFARLLALMARIRGAIDIEWVATWAPENTLFALQRKFGHYFRHEPDGRWHFFHNSFRAFLLDRTRAFFAKSGAIADAHLFRELGAHCHDAPDGSEWRWDELYYRALAGEHDDVLELAQLESFRRQYFAHRPPDLIVEDIRRAIRSARVSDDVGAFSQLVIAGAEFTDRAHCLRDVPTAELLLALGRSRAAFESVRDGNRLRVAPSRALQAAEVFAEAGNREEAERLLSLAEPLEVLSASGAPADHEADEANSLLDAWVPVAARFRTVPQLLTVIDRLRRNGERHGEKAEESTRRLQFRLRAALAKALRALRRWDDATGIVDHWKADTSDEAWQWWFWCYVNSWSDAGVRGEHERAEGYLNDVCARAGGRALEPDERVALAEGILRIRGDVEAARDLVKDVPQPPLVNPATTVGSNGFQPFRRRYQLNKLLGALGDARNVADLVPASTENEGLALFERNVVLVARLAGRASVGCQTSTSSFSIDVHPTLRLFSRAPGRDWRSWHLAQAGRTELYRLLIFAARRYGPEVADSLRTAFQQEWTRPEAKDFWPPEVIRSVVLSLAEAGAPTAWVFEQLTELDMHTGQAGDVDTRVQDALQQVRALLDAGAGVAAAQWYRRLLGLTHGIGSKDGQLNAWIHWAERASVEDPTGSAARFGQFASALPQLRDNSEVLRSAVDELLGATTRWTPEAGFALLRWCLDEGLVDFTGGTEAVLAATIERHANTTAAVHAAYRWLFLPIDCAAEDHVLPHLARRLIEQEIAVGGPARAAATVHDLAQGIVAVAATSSRHSRLHILDGAAHSAGVTGVDEPLLSRVERTRERESSSSPWEERDVDHFEGLSAPKAEILRRAASVAGVVDLVRREKPSSFFSWREAISDLIARANAGDVSVLADAFAASRTAPDRRWEIDLLLARRRLELGDRSGAWDLATRAFNEAPAYGWHRYYDGGSRLRCLETLGEIDPDRARVIAFDALSAELESASVSLRDLATGLHYVVPAITSQVPVLEIWEAIARHVTTLFEHGAPPTRTVTLTPTGRSPAIAVLEWIADYLSHATYQLAWGAQRAFVDLCRMRDPDATAVLIERLTAPAGPHQPILVVLCAVAEVDVPALTPFVEALRAHSRSSDFGVRMQARALLERLSTAGLASPPTVDPRPTAETHPVFDLALPPATPVRRVRERSANEPLAETDNPAEMVAAFETEIDALGALAGVQSEALSMRVVQIARELEPAALLETTERQLRAGLEQARLLLPFRRPRPALVRRALHHATAELFDTGRLSAQHISQVQTILRRSDPQMLVWRPGLRPANVAPLDGGPDGYFREGWIDAVRVDPSALYAPPFADGGVVLAEKTQFHWLESRRPTEVRVGARIRGFPEEEILRKDDLLRALCERWMVTTSADYLRRSARSDALVVLQDGISFETPAQTWLAFNPSIARALEWSPSKDGLFRWTDANGATMVESLWWEDGSPMQSSFRPREVVGEGWLVVATAAGASALRSRFGRLTACARVERRRREETAGRRAADQRLDE